MKRVFYILLGLLTFHSCTLQKRNYKKGYYVDWAHHKHQCKEIKVDQPSRSQTILASKEVDKEQLVRTNVIFPGDTCGDQLTQKNGDAIRVKIFEVTEELVKYKRCDNLDGPTYTIKKNNLTEIRYANGVKETVQVPDYVVTPLSETEKEYPGDLVLALVLSILLGGLSPFFSIPLAKKSKEKIKKNPERYKGLNMADFLIFFNWGIVVLFIALLVIVGIFDSDLFGLLFFIAWLIFMGFAAYRFYKRK